MVKIAGSHAKISYLCIDMTRRRAIKLSVFVTAAAIVAAVAYFVLTDTEHPLSPAPSRERYPIKGIDVSAHNGDIDFEKVKADSVDFVYIKATEGATFKDRNFNRNLRMARRAGLRVGAYHFFRFDSPGYMQGLNFLNSVSPYDLDLPLMIDVEEFANPRGYKADAIGARLTALIDHLEQRGHRVVLYSNKNGYNSYLRDRFDDRPLWICTFSSPDDDLDWVLWQYSHRGKVDGISHRVDLNTFNGSRHDFDRWINPELPTQ